MIVISRALWNAMFLQVLIGMTTAKETSNNYIRGRRGNAEYSKESTSRINNKGIRIVRAAYLLDREIDRNLLEDAETNSPDSDEEHFPYLASLMDESFNHICGGTLIASDTILTSASCGDKA